MKAKKIRFLATVAVVIMTIFAMAMSANAVRYVGDINGDGRVTAADARLVLRMAAGLDPLIEIEDEPVEPVYKENANTNSDFDKDYEKYVMAAHLYQAVIDSAKFPSSVYIERAYYIDNLGQGYPAVRLECAAANSMGGYGILYGVVIQYPIDGYEDNPYADQIYVYDNKYNYECNIYDNCPVVNYNGYEKLNISRIEEVHRDDINFY